MKNILLIFLIIISSKNYSQILKEKELAKIESFGIKLTNYNQNELQVTNDWNLILDKDRKRKKTKATGIIFTTLSILSTTWGAKIISENKNAEEGLGKAIGMMFVAGGITSVGISVPLFITSSKRKKARNELIKKYIASYP
jgi:hypothetical protein